MPTPTPPGTEFYWEWCNPLVVMMVLGLLILGAGIFFERAPISSRSRRSQREPLPDRPKRRRSTILMPESQMEIQVGEEEKVPAGLGRDRRTARRRKGKPVKVMLSTGDDTQEPLRGWVLDRSRGGLCIISPQEVPVGRVMGIRAAVAPEDSPWINIQVKNARRKRRRWALGCQFTEELPWAVLLLFG